MYIYSDFMGRVCDLSPQNMEGNSGWTDADVTALGDDPEYATLHDARGVLRYKLENGAAVQRTQEEMDADYEPMPMPPTEEERIAELEAAMTVLLGGETE